MPTLSWSTFQRMEAKLTPPRHKSGTQPSIVREHKLSNYLLGTLGLRRIREKRVSPEIRQAHLVVELGGEGCGNEAEAEVAC